MIQLEELSRKSWGADGTRIIAPQAGDLGGRANRDFSLLISIQQPAVYQAYEKGRRSFSLFGVFGN